MKDAPWRKEEKPKKYLKMDYTPSWYPDFTKKRFPVQGFAFPGENLEH
jgi:signal peptidase I